MSEQPPVLSLLPVQQTIFNQSLRKSFLWTKGIDLKQSLPLLYRLLNFFTVKADHLTLPLHPHDPAGEPNCHHNDTYHEVLHDSRRYSIDTPIAHSYCYLPLSPFAEKKRQVSPVGLSPVKASLGAQLELLWQNSCSWILHMHSSEGHTS